MLPVVVVVVVAVVLLGLVLRLALERSPTPPSATASWSLKLVKLDRADAVVVLLVSVPCAWGESRLLFGDGRLVAGICSRVRSCRTSAASRMKR